MKKSSAIRAQMAAMRDEIVAIVELATAEDREITDDEKKVIDRIQGIGDSEGEADVLARDLERAIRTEARLSERAAEMLNNGSIFGNSAATKGHIMQNSHGHRVTVLNRDDSFKATCRSEASKVSFAMGEAVKATVLGFNEFTPEPIRASMTESNDNRGGAMVPIELAGDLIDKARAKSVITQAGAQTVIMNSPQLMMVTVEGDPTFDVHPELETITASDITLGSRNLNAVTIATIINASRELVEDAPNFAEEVEKILSASLATQLDYYGINGHANMHPMGLLQNTDINSTGSIGAIDWLDITAPVTTIRTANYEPNAVIMHPSIHDALFNTESGDGTNSARNWLEAPPSIRDKQFLHSTNCPVGNVIVGEFMNLKWGLRQNALIEVSAVAGDAFEKHGVKIKITWRGDFLVTRPAAFETLADVTAS